MSADWWIGRASINILTLADGTSVLVPPELATNLRIPVWTIWLLNVWELVSVCAVFTGTLDEVGEVALKLFFQPNLHLFLGLRELELTEIVGLLRSIVKGGDDLEGRILNTLHCLLPSLLDVCLGVALVKQLGGHFISFFVQSSFAVLEGGILVERTEDGGADGLTEAEERWRQMVVAARRATQKCL